MRCPDHQPDPRPDRKATSLECHADEGVIPATSRCCQSACRKHVARDLGHDLARQFELMPEISVAGTTKPARAARMACAGLRSGIQLPAVAPALPVRNCDMLLRPPPLDAACRSCGAPPAAAGAPPTTLANLSQSRLVRGGRIVAALRVDLLLYRCNPVQHCRGSGGVPLELPETPGAEPLLRGVPRVP